MFFPREQLPGALRVISDWLPLTANVELIPPAVFGPVTGAGLPASSRADAVWRGGMLARPGSDARAFSKLKLVFRSKDGRL